jgi:DNA-binding HxlR family transcriptional regulator
MAYDRFRTQKETKERNERLVLKLLFDSPMRFKDLLEETGLSRAGLDMILKRLQETKQIESIIDSGKPAYSLTKKGEKTVKAIPIIQDNLESILKVKHEYSNEMGKFKLGYKGINFDVLNDAQVDANLTNVFKEIVKECLKKSENTIAEIPSIIRDKSELKGKMVLALTIDFDDMREQFLNRNNKTWKKFGLKWENEEDWERLFSGDDPK